MKQHLLLKSLVIGVITLAWIAGAKAQEILHPEMTVAADGGTYQKPMGTLGQKPDQPWTATTTAAGVNAKPNVGKSITITGEIIDLSCYLQLGKHGEKHTACGKKCLTNGQP